MSDELEDLRAAMERATPAPDETRKTANLRLAEKNFDELQGSRLGLRPSHERPGWARVTDGVKNMFNAMTTKGGLVATTALVAVAMVFVAQDQGRILSPPTSTVSVDEIGTRAKSDGQIERRSQAETATLQTRQEPEIGQLVEEEIILSEPALDAESFADDVAAAPAVSGLSQGLAENRARVGQGVETLVVPAPVEIMPVPEADTEAFANAETNAVKVVATEPVSTFSVDVDTAAYGVVRSSLMRGALPPQDAVRVEEMINYFPYNYPAPDGTHPFQPTVSVVETPWNADTQLVHIGIQGTLPEISERPPLNLVFLIDTSGSMQDANKLPLLKQSFRLMLSELRPEDQVAIVTYAGSAGRVLDATPAGERATIMAALDNLHAGGSTAGQAGLQQAYATAEDMAEDGDVTRVILATDGDFNVGLSDPDALKDFIADKRDSGTYLSVLGFGRGNLDDATMQALAQNGNGQAAYIDTLSEAQKVLVDQLTGALFPIANDVKIQVEFNPATIAEYRLIGYETRALRREDFNNDRVDAGDIGAGHTVTALYEVTPVGSPAVLNSPLRYGEAETASDISGELGFLKLRYKAPGESRSVLIETPIGNDIEPASGDVAFSSAIAGFGQLLRGGDYLGDWSYADAIALATAARGEDPFGYRGEAIGLMRLAETLAR